MPAKAFNGFHGLGYRGGIGLYGDICTTGVEGAIEGCIGGVTQGLPRNYTVCIQI